MKVERWLQKTIVYYLIILVILRIGLASFAWFFPKSIFFAEVTSDALLELINEDRELAGLSPLKLNDQLNLAAYQKAQDMIENQYFAHCSPAGIDPWYWFSQAGYRYQYAGENLAIHFFDSEEVYRAWMNSDSHRANILNPNYQEIGMAVVHDEFEGRPTAIVVQLFGTPYQIQYVEVAHQAPSSDESSLLESAQTEYSEKPESIVAESQILDSEEPLADATIVSSELLRFDEGVPIINNWRLRGISSVGIAQAEDNYWFRGFKFISRSYENLMQQLIFYGVILTFLYLSLSLIFKSREETIRFCGRTTLFALILMLLAFLTKDIIWNWMSYQIIIG